MQTRLKKFEVSDAESLKFLHTQESTNVIDRCRVNVDLGISHLLLILYGK